MDLRDIAPVPPPPNLRSVFSSDSIPKPSWRIPSISVEDLRLKFKQGGLARNGSKLQREPHNLEPNTHMACQNGFRPCQQAYARGKPRHYRFESEDVKLFESHEATEKDDLSKGRPRKAGESVRESHISIKLPDISEHPEGSSEDNLDIHALTKSSAPSLPPIPRRSSKREHVKASSDVGVGSRFVSGRQRLEPGFLRSYVDFAYVPSKEVEPIDSERPPTPPPKDIPFTQLRQPIPTREYREAESSVQDFTPHGIQPSFMTRSSFAHKLLPRKSMIRSFKKEVPEEEDASSDSSIMSIHPLIEDDDLRPAKSTTKSEGDLRSRNKSTFQTPKPQKGKQLFFQNSGLYRNLMTAKPAEPSWPKSQRFRGLQQLLSLSQPREIVPGVPKIPTAYDPGSLQSRRQQTSQLVSSSPPMGSPAPTQTNEHRVRNAEDGERGMFVQRLGENRKYLNTLTSPFRSKKADLQTEDKLRAREKEEFEQEKTCLFVALNQAREPKDEAIARQCVKKAQHEGVHVASDLQVPPSERLEKLKFDNYLDSMAQDTADEQDFYDESYPRSPMRAPSYGPVEPTTICKDGKTGQICLIGPAQHGAAATASAWLTGAYRMHAVPMARQKHSSDAEEVDYERECLCNAHIIWRTITHDEYRYIGLARTRRERRWIIHLAAEKPSLQAAKGTETQSPSLPGHDASSRTKSSPIGTPLEPVDELVAKQVRPALFRASSFYSDNGDPPETPLEPIPPVRLCKPITPIATCNTSADRDNDEEEDSNAENPPWHAWPSAGGPDLLSPFDVQTGPAV